MVRLSHLRWRGWQALGRALEGTINITQEDIDEVQSDEGFPSVSLEALLPAKVKMLELLKK